MRYHRRVVRRVIIACGDEDLGKQLVPVLTAAGGEVELRDSLAEVPPEQLAGALCVLHVEVEPPVPWLRSLDASTQVIVLARDPSLAMIVELMEASPAIVGVLGTARIDTRRLFALGRRVLTGELFDIDQLVRSGTAVELVRVRDASERMQCIEWISKRVAQVHVGEQVRSAIEQCLDELLMNALYDAPVDVDGRSLFTGISAAERVTLRIEQAAEVRFALDGTQCLIAVRDAFGSLGRDTVLRTLRKSSKRTVDRHAGGAGVGLYLLATSATTVCFRVIPGLATEVVCTFDLDAPTRSLEHFGFELATTDVTNTLTSGRVPAGTRPVAVAEQRRRRRRLAVAVAAAAVAVAIAGVAWSQLADDDAPATVELDSTPRGARVTRDGQILGETPIKLTSLPAGETVALALDLRGYDAATVSVRVPSSGDRATLLQPLVRSARFTEVRFVSDPPGARVIDLAAAPTVSRTYTPATMFVEVDKPQRFVLTMPNHTPLTLEFVAKQGTTLEKGGALTPLMRD